MVSIQLKSLRNLTFSTTDNKVSYCLPNTLIDRSSKACYFLSDRPAKSLSINTKAMTRNPVQHLDRASSSLERGDASKSSINIRVITFNIRYATENPFKGEELWKVRCPRLCSQLIFNSLEPESFICLQEVLHSQLMDIVNALNHSSPPDDQWSYIGVGRDDGKEAGEYSPIIYRPSIWHLKRWETRWLSETPDVPSKGWDAACIRIVTIGDFVHFKSEQKITVLSTHFDHAGPISREKSAEMILDRVTKFHDASAILLAGDFNSPPDDGAYQVMTAPDSIMEDIRLSVPEGLRYGNDMTFTSFGYVDNQPSRIDFIFSRKGDKITYRTYAVLANRFDDGVYLSDHRACVTDLFLRS